MWADSVPVGSKALNDAEAKAYEQNYLYGKAIYLPNGQLSHVEENDKQSHGKEQYVNVKVEGFRIRKNESGRIRVVVWDSPDAYGQEGVKPFRSSSHWAKDASDGTMLFKIGGLEPGKKYSFFAHFDKNNDGKVNRLFGIPTEPYIFSNAANQGQGPGLSREGLHPPKFSSTLVSYNKPGQEIILAF